LIEGREESAVEEAERPETRQRRIEKRIAALTGNKKL
jgi:uncharacterized protein YdeI (YjbR/CyaY-like superfamily)